MDGSEVTGGPVTHDTQVLLTINHHEEDIRLHCIMIRNAPIILGLPWLKLYDPVIGWKNHTVKFHSGHCAEKCLQTSPRANTVLEENAMEQYYKKTLEEKNWEIGETDSWEVCSVVIDKIKETLGTSANPTILTDHKKLEYWKTKKNRPGKLAGKPDILSRESGDSPWEGDMKHRQNHSRILLHEALQRFNASEALHASGSLQANTMETISLGIDKELLSEIQVLSAADKEIQEIRRKKTEWNTVAMPRRAQRKTAKHTKGGTRQNGTLPHMARRAQRNTAKRTKDRARQNGTPPCRPIDMPSGTEERCAYHTRIEACHTCHTGRNSITPHRPHRTERIIAEHTGNCGR